MKEIADYLQKNYYTKYAGCPSHLIPDNNTLIKALEVHSDKVVAVKENDNLVGVAVFLKLGDETYANIESQDLSNEQVLRSLLQENGKNIHFILITANGYQTIREGMRKLRSSNPKSVSWWNPEYSHLHKYNFN